jgi:DNA repair exonuclease SbcCD ATPase subunit
MTVQAVDETATETLIDTDAQVAPPAENNASEAPAAEATDDTSDVIVTIGEDAPPQEDTQAAPAWVRDLRKRERENVKRIKELEQRLSEKEQPVSVGLPVKPTLESCDYDTEEFESRITSWHDAKRQHEQIEAQQRQAQDEAQTAWQAKLNAYEAAKASLPARDVDDAEQAVREVFNEVQWSILVDGADNAALLIYALGKNPAKAKELAAVKSLSQFAFKAARIEAEVKVNKRTAPKPETALRGTSPGAVGSGDATLERLRDEALRTGDMTRLVAYKRQLRNS